MERYGEIAPRPELAEFVECYWWSDAGPAPTPRAVLPDGCVDILYRSRRGEPVALSAVGLMTRATETAPAPGEQFFGVRFRPAMAHLFLPEAPLLTDRIEPLEHGSLAEQLAEAGSVRKMAAVMERHLRVPPARAVGTQISARHDRRLCRAAAGVSPKFLERILRFRRAAERIAARAPCASRPEWAQFALECGYSDQAHLIHEFRTFSGLTPGRFLQYRAAAAA